MCRERERETETERERERERASCILSRLWRFKLISEAARDEEVVLVRLALTAVAGGVRLVHKKLMHHQSVNWDLDLQHP